MSLLENYLTKGAAKLSEYDARNVETLTPHISDGNSKVGKAKNYSILPIFTCKNCKECKGDCYAIKHANRFKNVMNAWAENTSIIQRDMERMYDAVNKAMDTADTFRAHVGGEFINIEHFKELNSAAARHKNTITWSYTTNYDDANAFLDDNEKADNFALMFSAGTIKGKVDNPHNMPLFIIVDSLSDVPRGAYICPGHCDICIKARRGCPYGETTYCLKHR